MSKIGEVFRNTYSETIPTDPLNLSSYLADTTENITIIVIPISAVGSDQIAIESVTKYKQIKSFCAYNDIQIENYVRTDTDITVTICKSCKYIQSYGIIN
jgi:hypothetical protein